MPSDTYHWSERAKCAGVDTNLFYPPRDKSLYKPIADQSKAICRGKDGRPECAARWDCAWDAISREEPHGIWGGMSHRERNALVRKWERKHKRKKRLEDFILDGGK